MSGPGRADRCDRSPGAPLGRRGRGVLLALGLLSGVGLASAQERGGDASPPPPSGAPKPGPAEPDAAPPTDEQDGDDRPPQGPFEYALTLFHGAPYVRLQLGAVEGLFLVDTGANATGVDAAWLNASKAPRRPGQPGTVGGTTGALAVERAILERVALGHGFFKDVVVTLQSFAGFAHPPEGPQSGLLGTDLLGSYQLDLDYRGARLRLALRHERRPLPAGLRPTTARFERNLPTVNVRLGGLDLPCRLDSGASYRREGVLLDVNRAAVRALEAAGLAFEQVDTVGLIGISGPERCPVLRPARGPGLTLEVAQARLDDVLLVVHATGTLAGPDPLALASASVMARLERVVLDPFDRLLWVPSGRLAPGE